MEILAQIFNIFLLGLAAGAIPGPVIAAAFTEALRNGFSKSLRVVYKSFASEVIIASFILAIFFSFDIDPKFFYAVSFIGAGVLVWMACQVWKIKEIGGNEEIFTFRKVFLLMLGNGLLWIFWITICVPQAFLLNKAIAGGNVLFLVLFEAGWILSTVSMVFIFSRFREFLIREKIVPIVFRFFSLLLVFFAIKMLVESVVYLTAK
jgi:threonine/homoserine/homoserine lactone efflux protein